MKQRTKEWYDARKKRVTASNAGAILGLDPFRNRDDVMRAMVREALGAEPEFTGNVATQYGQYHEDGAIAEFEMSTDLTVETCGFFTHEDWLGASPDGLIGDEALIEVKCPYGIRNDKLPNFKSIDEQDHYYAQVQIQLFCTRRERAYFYQWAMHGSMIEAVTKNQLWLDENLPKLRQFYAEFLHELENNAYEHLAPRRVVVDTPQAHKAMAEWDELREQIELLEERKKDLLAEIVSMAKDSDAEIAGRKLTKVEKAGSVSFSKVVKDHCKDVDLEPYRGKPSEFWKLT